MVRQSERRRIDWAVIVPGQSTPLGPVRQTPEASRLAALTAGILAMASPASLDQALRHAGEFGRDVLELERCAIYLFDEESQLMVGTFGTDARGNTVDEHALSYQFGQVDRETFARAAAGLPWTVYEDCPHIAESEGETHVIGRGWVACTAICGPRGPLGILFNDTALTHAPLDDAKQSRAAILCSVLGHALEPCRDALSPVAATEAPDPQRRIVSAVTALLIRDPTLSCEALARELQLSARQLTRSFQREARKSLVEYRNELRLAGFLERIAADASDVLQAARGAGFGSYAQFHRVFRARFGRGPREYLHDQRPARFAAASLTPLK